jgi:hypothetical protein
MSDYEDERYWKDSQDAGEYEWEMSECEDCNGTNDDHEVECPNHEPDDYDDHALDEQQEPQQPIGAWVSVKYKGSDEVYENYISFGEYNQDTDCDSFGVLDEKIFFYCSLKEMLGEWSATDDWNIVAVKTFVYHFEQETA